MSAKKLHVSVILVLLIVGVTLQASIFQVPLISAQPVVVTPRRFNEVIASLDKTLFQQEVELLSKESRFTGYPGFFKAANYIAQVFRENGIPPYGQDYFEWFNVTVPIVKQAWLITETGRNITLHPFYPNLVNPSQYVSDDWDTLIYVGKGDLKDFDGKDVKGKFVLMDYGSGWNYYNALMLGAKGVIFIPEDPSSVDRPESELKLTLLPVNFPKLYLPPDEKSLELLELCKRAGASGIKVKIHSIVEWENVRVPNVVGFVKGADPARSQKIVVVAAYYDSFCAIPSLAYGATDALGVVTLLHFARFLAKNPPSYSVMLVALAGHYQGLWGAREFVERYFDELESRIIAFASMKLASDSDQVGIYAVGSAYSYSYLDILVRRYTWLVSRVFGPWLAEMRMVLGSRYGENFVDGILGSHPPYLRSAVPYDPHLYGYFAPSAVFGAHAWYLRTQYAIFDSEPFTLAMYGGGFTFYTTNAFRKYQGSPADTVSNIDFDNVWPQVYFIHCTLWAMLNEEINLPTSKRRLSDDWGYVTVRVKVTTYNMLTSYWDIVNFTQYPELRGRLLTYITYGGLKFVQKVEDDGTVTIHGLKPYMGGSVDVFAIDERGRITWTTDMGVWQAPGGKWFTPTSHPYVKMVSIFECASIFVLLTMQPTDFRTVWFTGINDARAHSPMIRQNSLQADIFAMAFVQPEIPAEIMLSVGTGLPSVVLNNASTSRPEGFGYRLAKGEQIVLSPFHVVENLYVVVNSRYESLRSRNVIIPVLEYYADLVKQVKGQMADNLQALRYSNAFGACLFAWAALLNWYNSLMTSLYQVITSVAAFFAISILFSILFERLTVKSEGLRRLISLLALITMANFALYILHPAYHVASNWVILLLAVSAVSLNIVLLFLAFMNAYTMAKATREATLGKHYLEISRTGLFLESMVIAVENMRKRKLRSILILGAVTVIAFSTMSLASVTTAPVLLPQPINVTYTPSFEGLLVRAYPWSPINPFAYNMIASYLEGSCYVSPRAFLYPPSLMVSMPGLATGLTYIAFSPQLKTQVYALLALAPEEAYVSNIDKLLVEGRWFHDDDVYAVILTQSVANSLSQELGRQIGVNSTLNLWSINVRVVGIIKDEVERFANPDAEPITPLDPQSPIALPQHIFARNTMIIPFKLYQKLAPTYAVANIGIRPLNEEVANHLKSTLPYVINYPIYSSIGGSVSAWIARQWISTIGFEFILIPAIIASAAVLDMMLANIYERKREIHVFISVGMAPSHVTLAFLTEALTYVVPAVFLGYVAGVLATNLMLTVGAFPEGLYPNYTSMAILMIALLIIAIVLVAAYYPSSLAGKIAIPSRVRKWIEAEKGPAGDEWRLSYPLVLTTAREVIAFFNFVKGYVESLAVRESAYYAEKVEISERESKEGHELYMVASCRFAPYDLGIKSDVILRAFKKGDSPVYNFDLVIKRLEGYRQAWRTSAITVAGDIRRQAIVWRSLSPEEREKYARV
ncbi:MAG: FtsX-like permease family protein [Thermosphaera sp.]